MLTQKRRIEWGFPEDSFLFPQEAYHCRQERSQDKASFWKFGDKTLVWEGIVYIILILTNSFINSNEHQRKLWQYRHTLRNLRFLWTKSSAIRSPFISLQIVISRQQQSVHQLRFIHLGIFLGELQQFSCSQLKKKGKLRSLSFLKPKRNQSKFVTGWNSFGECTGCESNFPHNNGQLWIWSWDINWYAQEHKGFRDIAVGKNRVHSENRKEIRWIWRYLLNYYRIVEVQA